MPIIFVLVFSILINTGCTLKNKEVKVLLDPYYEESEVLDPALFRYVGEYTYLENLSLRLIEMDHRGNYSNLLAKNIDISEDRKTYKISIKKAFFADGTQIRALDVVNSIKRLIKLGSPHSDPRSFIKGASQLKEIDDFVDGLRVVNDSELVIILNNPMKEIFYYLQLVDYSVLHPSLYSKDKILVKDWGKYNSGAYFLIKEGDRFVFKKNKSFTFFDGIENTPEKVVPIDKKTLSNVIKEVEEKKISLGGLTFNDYLDNFEEINQSQSIKVFGQGADAIFTLDLNIKSEKFKDLYTRQWIQKKIMNHFKIDKKLSHVAKKANQYFLPGAKGYVPDAETNSIIKDVDLNNVPSSLKDGLVINTFTTMAPYLIPGIEKKIEEALGIPIKLKLDVLPKDYHTTFLIDRKFDAFLMARSMSYKVISEAVNIVYTSENPSYLDPTGKIKKLMKSYLETDDQRKEETYISDILRQMIYDSECIPLHYIANPLFYNSDILEISKASIDESIKLWKISVK